MENEAKFYHGGYGLLSKGDLVLPPSETGAKGLSEYGAEGVCDPTRVYITTDINGAIMFASLSCVSGRVYEVMPIGEISDDPDCNKKGLSYECKSAKVVQVMNVKLLDKKQILDLVSSF